MKLFLPTLLVTIYFIVVKSILFGFREGMVDNVNDIITKEKVIPDKKSNKNNEDAKSADGTRIIDGDAHQIELKSVGGDTKKSTKDSSLGH